MVDLQVCKHCFVFVISVQTLVVSVMFEQLNGPILLLTVKNLY